jgi:hypothetical protein
MAKTVSGMQAQVVERREEDFGLVSNVTMPFEDVYCCFDQPSTHPQAAYYAGHLYFKIGVYKFIHHAP